MNGTAKPHNYSFSDVAHALTSDRGHVVISTSGSTGVPKHVLLSGAALRASGESSDRALSGPGQWLLTLPTNHIAGVNVLARSVLAGTEPVLLDRTVSFTPQGFISATEQLRHRTTYVSLVPTQLHRLLRDNPLYDESLAALQSYAGILVGGAATAPALMSLATSAGLKVVTTYGMSETSGGCVYNGKPLDIARVRTDSEGRIWLAGPMLAQGYLDTSGTATSTGFGPGYGPDAGEGQMDSSIQTATPARLPDQDPPASGVWVEAAHCTHTHAVMDSAAFRTDESQIRWHRTNDLGQIDLHTGLLTVFGRADDLIVSGGIKVSPHTVEHALAGNFGISEALVVGIPDPEWGARVVALVTQSTSAKPDTAAAKAALTANLGRGHAPRAIFTVDQLPLTDSGKPHRRKALDLAVEIAQANDTPPL